MATENDIKVLARHQQIKIKTYWITVSTRLSCIYYN